MRFEDVLSLIGGLALFLYGMSAMGEALERCAARLGAAFADAGRLPLAPDGIHLTQLGHVLLAERVLAAWRTGW